MKLIDGAFNVFFIRHLWYFSCRADFGTRSEQGQVIADVDMVAVLSTSKAVFLDSFFITSLASGMKSKWEAEERAG